MSALAREDFSRLFAEFEHTAYRLELLPAYDVENEKAALAAFTAGREPDVYPGKGGWLSTVRAATDAGKVMSRVHVVTEPLSDYLWFEIGWAYRLNQGAGEDIRILTADRAPAIVTGAGDYWLFDSRTLVRMEYDERGRFLGVSLADNPGDVVAACYARDAAMHYAVPLDEYAERMPKLLRAS